MQNNSDHPLVDKTVVVSCFRYLYSPQSSPDMRKQADQYLIDLEKNPIDLLSILLQIFQQKTDMLLSFQALVYFCNVLKRNWTSRRFNKEHSQFQATKKAIKEKIIELVASTNKTYLPTLFDILKFVVKIDYPHSYPTFSFFALHLLGQTEKEGASISQITVLMMKQLREIFLQLSERKTPTPKKQFQEHFRPLINAAGSISIKFKSLIEQQLTYLTSDLMKISKYSDQILIYILRTAPADSLEDPQTANILGFLQQKLEYLLNVHRSASKESKSLLQKNIKSLIYDMGLLELTKPLMLSWTLPRLYEVLFYVITNHSEFVKNASLRYSLIGIRRILKEFSYYASDELFSNSIRSKQSSANTLALHQICHQFYSQNITDSVVTNLLNFLLQTPFSKSSQPFLDMQENSLIEKGQEKELSVEGCVLFLIQALLERFSDFTIGLIQGLTANCIQTNWTNIDQRTLTNLFSVVAILPTACKKQLVALQSFPVLQILEFIYKSPRFQFSFPAIVSGWLNSFQNNQLASLTEILLRFMEESANRANEDENVTNILMACCQCLNKIVLQRCDAVNIQLLVDRAVPLSLLLLGKLENPQVLWPMVSLVANLISRAELKGDYIVKSLEGGQLSLLIQHQSQLLVEALCEMLRGFLCVLPRNVPAHSLHELVCGFLNNHLSKVESLNHQKIFYLWYIAIRQYSPIHGCDRHYIDLFFSHFRKNLFRKTATLVYILEEYMLSGLIPTELQQFVDIIIQCYSEADSLDKDERDKLKIAALSFMITLIAKYDLQQVNSNRMLQLILNDFCNWQNGASPTIRNSLLSIINRYIIKYCSSFFSYLEGINLPFTSFLDSYTKNMEFLTSHTAIKINIIAILSFLNSVDPSLILPHLSLILKVAIPEVELYLASLNQQGFKPITGAVDNSPSLRFASNVLSERKEELRKNQSFQNLHLGDLFQREMKQFLLNSGLTPSQVSQSLGEGLSLQLMRLL